jgi:hypothetical protein
MGRYWRYRLVNGTGPVRRLPQNALGFLQSPGAELRRETRSEPAFAVGTGFNDRSRRPACQGEAKKPLIAVTAECRDLANSLGPVRKWANFRRMRRLGLRARQYGYRYQQFESRSLRHDLGYSTDYAFRRGDGGISSVFPGLCRCQFHRRLCRDRARPDLRDTGAFVSRGAHGEYGCLLKTRG